MCSAGTTLPDGWRADAGGFRPAGFGMTADATISPSCVTLRDDVAPAGSSLSAVADPARLGPNRERFQLGSVLASADAYDLTGDGATETAVFELTILRAASTGTGSCAGCAVPVVIHLGELQLQGLNDVPATYLRMTTPLQDVDVAYDGGIIGCYPVPAINRTWGAIKALYR